MAINNTDYPTFEETSHTEDTDSLAGPGGGVMDIFASNRRDLIDSTVRTGTTDKTTFGLPGAVYETYHTPYEVGYRDSERANGVNVSLSPLGPDGAPIGGTSIASFGDETLGETTILRQSIMGFNPPNGVTSGDSQDVGEFDFEFIPSIDGLSIVRDDQGSNMEFGLIQYGELTGSVYDVRGEPVSSVLITSSGGGTQSGGDGKYDVVSPGGITQTFTSLDGYDKEVTISGGQTTNVDWQYAGVLIRARLIDGSAVVGADVYDEYSDETKRTDSNGDVLFGELTPGISTTITILGQIDIDISTGQEGEEKAVRRQFGAGIRGVVRDADTGANIRGVDVTLEGLESSAESQDDGKFSLGIVGSGDKNVSVAKGDRRYEVVTITVDADRKEVVEKNIELIESKTIGEAV